MGTLPSQQNALFYDFCLEKHVARNHLLRQIDQFLDFDQIRVYLAPYYSHTGRPSIDPELMVRMLLIGYCYGIRSERRLCEEVNYNLAYRWFCRLGLEEEVPNHSSFSKNRHGRFRESDLFRQVFSTIVEQCITIGLVEGEGFAVDASYVKADASRGHAVENDERVGWTPKVVNSRAVREYVDALDKQPELRRRQKRISLSDPMSQWTAAKGAAIYAYSTNYVIDIQNNIIMDVEASPSIRTLEVNKARVMIDRIESNYGIKPKRLLGDTAYGDAENLNYLLNEKGIEPHIPVWERQHRKDGTFLVEEFIWDESENVYICPANNRLRTKGRTNADNRIRYRASQSDCDRCIYKKQCCPTDRARKIARNRYESAREKTRLITQSSRYKKSFHERKKVEMVFAHMKRDIKLERLRLRGLSGANDEFILAATAQNLRRMAKLSIRPPPHSRQ